MRNVLTADDNYNNYFYQDDAHKIEGDKHRQEVVFEKGGIVPDCPRPQPPRQSIPKHDSANEIDSNG